MTIRHAIISSILLAVGPTSVLAGCSSGSGATSSAVTSTATAMPVAAAASGSYIGRGAAANLAPDADTLRHWTRGGFVIRDGARAGSAAFEMEGTGKPGGSGDAFSPPVRVTPGQSYIFSLWIDPTHVASGSAVLGIYAPSRMVSYGQVRVNPGPAGRYSVGATIPKGQKTVVIDFQPNGVAVASGETLTASQPMLVKGVLPPAMVAGTPAPKPAKAAATPASPSP